MGPISAKPPRMKSEPSNDTVLFRRAEDWSQINPQTGDVRV